MALTSPVRVDAPPVVPARGGLLSVADITEAAAGSRIEFGVNYYSFLCGTVGLWPAWCGTAPGLDYDAVKNFEGGQSSWGYPFVVYAGVECDLFGRAEYGDAARAKLVGGEDRAVAAAFMNQAFFGVNDLPMQDLAVPITDAASALDALAELEQYAGENYAGLPVIHMNKKTATLLAQYNVLLPNLDGSLVTLQGTPVANSAGYPDDLIFVTGAVHIWRTAPTVVSTDAVMRNLAQGLAERVYVVATDCLLAFTGTAPTTVVAAPTITTVAPTTGPLLGGTAVTLTGTSFTEARGVTVAGQSVPFTVVSPTSITFTTPVHLTAEAVDIVVEHPSGDATKPDAFTYTLPPAPTLTGVAPSSGSTAGGTPVTLTGTNFNGSTSVTFGGTPGTSFTVVSPTSITVTTPAHAAGAVTVVVVRPGTDATLTNGFTYNVPPPPAPTISGVAPATGAAAGGTATVITGTNFTGATGVTFGGTAGTAFSVTDATHIAVTTPAHAAGAVSVVVQHPSGNATSANAFTYA